MANNKEYNAKKKALSEHYSNRILAVFTLGVFNFILLFYLKFIAIGRMGVTLLMHHYAVYNTLAICSLVIAAVLFVLWKQEKGTRAFYKENYLYFWIYFLVAAIFCILIKLVQNALGSVDAWFYVYVAADVLYVVASTIYFMIVSHIKVGKIQK